MRILIANKFYIRYTIYTKIQKIQRRIFICRKYYILQHIHLMN